MKKRRVTDDQARLLAIKLIETALSNEMEFGSQIIPPDMRKELWYFKDVLPPNWADGQTSDQSWNQLWESMRLQLLIIMHGLDREALRVRIANPDFTYFTLFPVAGKSVKVP